MIMQEQVYSIEETARLLRVHPDTIRRMLKAGTLRHSKVGKQYRIPQSEIDRLLHGDSDQGQQDK